MKLVLVGEDNPYGSNPRYALFCRPRNSAGGRLQRLILGVTERTYLRSGLFERGNLCSHRWAVHEARERAAKVLVERPDDAIVMFGRKVADAFARAMGEDAIAPFTRRGRLISLPHPSGRCREWDRPGAIDRARALLREVSPETPFGELTANNKADNEVADE